MPPLGVGRQQVDDLDAGDQDLRLGRLLDELRRGTMDRRLLFGVDRAALVDRLADHVEDAPQGLGADRHHDRATGVDHLGAAHQPVGRVHRDRAHGVLAEVLRHFERQHAAGVVDVQRAQDRRQLALEADVDDRADDLGDRADFVGWCSRGYSHILSLSPSVSLRAKRSNLAPSALNPSRLLRRLWLLANDMNLPACRYAHTSLQESDSAPHSVPASGRHERGWYIFFARPVP